MQQLIESLRRRAGQRRTPDLRFAPDLQVFAGLDFVPAGKRYHWDGTRRGTDAHRPFFVFQYTLDGWGTFAQDNKSVRVPPGQAFCVSVPSEHTYFLPPESPGWTHVWINIHHPYLVQRLIDAQRTHGPLLTLATDSALLASALRLFDGAMQTPFADEIAQEKALFDFFFEFQRFVSQTRYPQQPREQLLQQVRARLDKAPTPFLSVAELADTFHLSRSRFSHFFKQTTGMAPHTFVKQVQMETAARLLLTTDWKLEAVAQATGFSEANHFCKSFRRYFHLSPGQFRRQMGNTP